MTVLIALLLIVVGATTEDAVSAAKQVISSHEKFAASGDLDRAMTNIADDVVVLVPNTALVRGKEAFREFYRAFLAQGRWEFTHEYQDAAVTGDAVVLDGVARGTFTTQGGQPSPIRGVRRTCGSAAEPTDKPESGRPRMERSP